MRAKTGYLLIILLAVFAEAKGQHSQVMYHMNIPQNHLLNPALRPSNALYIGLPVLSGIKANVDNNFISYSDIFMKDPVTDSVITILHPDYNIDDFLAKINKRNFFETSAMVQMLGLGFNVGKEGYMFLDINDRVEGSIIIPGDLFRLALKGNEGFAGSEIDLSSLGGELKYYREAGLGFSTPLSNKFRIGFKGKVLFGVGAVSVDNRALSVAVDEDYSHTLNADLAVNISAPLTVTKDAEGDIESIEFDDSSLETTSQMIGFLSGTDNIGFGVDLGASYSVTDRLVISASVLDLGYIKWKSNVTNLKAESQFVFDGLDMLEVLEGTKTFDEVGEEMLDSLKNSFKVSDSNDPFTTWLPAGITAGGSYRLNRTFSLGIFSYTKFIKSQVRESLTFSGNANLGTAISAAVSYTFSTAGYDNLGVGLAARAGIFQLYVLADRIPFNWDMVVMEGTTVPLPSGWNVLNVRVGLNLLFGNKIRQREDKPMLEVL